MKKIILTVTLLALAFSFTAAQKKPLKQVQVTSQTVARQPAGKAYVLDLTRSGTIYNVAAGTDYSRVQVRTSKGEMTVAELLKKSGKNVSGKLRIGLTSDIRAQRLSLGRPGGGGGRLNYSCSDLACACTGDDDCNDMFESGKCGLIAVCYPDGCICLVI